MLKFVAAAEIEAQHAIDLSQPTSSGLSGAELGTLTMLVLNRFIEQADWDSIVSIYLTGLADDVDISLIQRAVKALIEGGVEFVGR